MNSTYRTTPRTAANAKATNNKTMEKLKTAAGSFMRQNGGSIRLRNDTQSYCKSNYFSAKTILYLALLCL